MTLFCLFERCGTINAMAVEMYFVGVPSILGHCGPTISVLVVGKLMMHFFNHHHVFCEMLLLSYLPFRHQHRDTDGASGTCWMKKSITVKKQGILSMTRGRIQEKSKQHLTMKTCLRDK
jgi:hypothetical protein